MGNRIFKKFRNIAGASLVEVLLMLGIMALLTPVAVKYAFNDVSDVRYMNLAKQLKQLTKALSAYSISKRSEWNGNSGVIEVSALEDYGLDDSVVDKIILDNMHLKYITESKDGKNEKILYAFVNMAPFKLDAISFNKTLFYTQDNIGKVIKGPCKDCDTTTDYCACSINEDWGIPINSIEGVAANDLLAVVRIDENFLASDFESSIYLNRTKVDTMNHWLSLKYGNTRHDVKNVAEAFTDILVDDNEPAGKVSIVKTQEANLQGRLIEIGNIYFRQSKDPHIRFGESGKIWASTMIFEVATVLGSFEAKKALLSMDALGGYKPKIMVGEFGSGGTEFKNLDLQNLIINGFTDSTTGLIVYGFKEGVGALTGELESNGNYRRLSKLKVQAPNVDVDDIKAKIINVTGNMSASCGTTFSNNGIIKISDNFVLHKIKAAESSGRNIKTVVDAFGSGIRALSSEVDRIIRESIEND